MPNQQPSIFDRVRANDSNSIFVLSVLTPALAYPIYLLAADVNATSSLRFCALSGVALGLLIAVHWELRSESWFRLIVTISLLLHCGVSFFLPQTSSFWMLFFLIPDEWLHLQLVRRLRERLWSKTK